MPVSLFNISPLGMRKQKRGAFLSVKVECDSQSHIVVVAVLQIRKGSV